MKGKRVFISGGNGVIGNELVKKLYQEGAIIYVGDLKPRPLNWPSEINYRQGDLNYISKEEILNFNPEVFFHLAATFERSTESYEFWSENFHHNVSLSNYLMGLLKDSSELKRVIFASSYLIYNQELYQSEIPQESPFSLSESHPISPRNLTGMAKLSHEIELNFLSNFKKDQYTTCSARIFRGYGKNSRDVISRWVRSLINNEEIQLFNKEGVFDYIFAEDTAEGLIRLAKTNYSGIINLGTGKARRVEDVINILKTHFPDANITSSKSSLPFEASQANIDLLYKTIQWIPENSLEQGIHKIIEFEKTRNGKYQEEKNQFGNILITSISKKVPLINSVKNAAKKLSPSIKIFGADIDKNVIGKYFVDEFWEMPRIKQLQIEDVVTFCKKNNITAIIPTRDGELEFWANNKNTFLENGINVMVSHKDSVNYCIDKLEFYNFCKSNSIPVIETSTDINKINEKNFVVKERFGAGSLSIGLNLNYDEAFNHSKKLNNPIFQPFISGQEISIDVYIQKNGKIKGLIPRIREYVVDGESQITTLLSDELIINDFLEYVNKLNLYGHVIFQVIKSKNNYQIIECNCRFGGASTFSLKAGLDSFYWFILESNQVDITDYPFIPYKGKLKLVRHTYDSFYS